MTRDITKLPQWARERLATLEQANGQLLQQILEYEAREGSRCLELQPYEGLNGVSRSQLFPVQDTVAIWADRRRREGVIVQAMRDGSVEVSTPSGALQIMPRASNVFTVRALGHTRDDTT